MEYPEKIEPQEIEALIDSERFVLMNENFIICVLKVGGFTIIGENSCLNPNDFDTELGKESSRADALNKLWELEGYHRSRIKNP